MSEKLEKAKKGLACCERRGYCEGHCPYYEPEKESLECTSELAHDTLALIQQQRERIEELEAAKTARVMTLEEISDSDIVWIETREDIEIGQRCKLAIPIAPFDMAFKMLGRKEKRCFDIDDYRKTWRPWTSRPTGEQRRNTPWE